MRWPLIGSVVAQTGSTGILRRVLRRVLQGGLHDLRTLPPAFVAELQRCGARPGHARAAYPAIRLPVTLVDGEEDGSRQEERAANAQAIPTARSLLLRGASHFSSLETAAARRAHHSRGGLAWIIHGAT
jgi:pimeloyl-ACP methyl ester carboxylesterase